MEWVATVVVIVLVIVLMDGVRMVQNPKREVDRAELVWYDVQFTSLPSPYSTCRYSTLFRLDFFRGNKNKFRTLVFDTLRFVQMTASPIQLE